MFISLVNRMSLSVIRSCHQPHHLHLVPYAGLISLPSVISHYVTHARLFPISPVLVANSCGVPFGSYLRFCEMLSWKSVVPLDSGSSFLFYPWMLFLHIKFTQVDFSCSFSWTQGWWVLVCPCSTSISKPLVRLTFTISIFQRLASKKSCPCLSLTWSVVRSQ